MDFQMLSSYGIVEKLKCASCKNVLSHFPIYSCDNQNICGRCVQPEETPYFRNNLYEQIAQYLKFPCRYQNEGCDEEILPSNIPQHERTCPYRKIKCPMVDTCHCDWEGSRPYLLQHCRNEHIDRFINKGFQINLSENNENKYLLENEDLLLYVESKFDLSSKYFECAIYHLEDETDNLPYSFLLTLKNGSRSVSVQVVATKFNEKHLTDISLEPLRSRSNSFPLQARGNIIFGEIGDDINLKTLEHLKDLKCSDCCELITPSIFHCTSKHVFFCSKCLKKHLPSCTTCKQLIHVIQSSESLKNIDCVDEITNFMDHSCKYKEKGCSVVVKVGKTDRHEEFCPFKEVECPLFDFKICSWKGSLQHLVAHIEEAHQNRKIQCDSENSLTVNNDRNYGSYQEFIECFDSFFYLIYVRNGNRVNWIVQAVDKCEENFYYEIEVVDGCGNGTRMFRVRAPCSPLTKKDQIWDRKKYTCLMYIDQIKELMSNSELLYRINIFKKDKNK